MKSNLQPVKLLDILRKKSLKTIKKSLLNSKYKNVVVTVLVFSIMFAGVVAFTYPNGKAYAQEISESSANTESVVAVANTNAENLVTAYGLYIDGKFIAAVNNEADITASLNTLLNGKVASYSVPNVTSSQFMNEIKIENGQYNAEYVTDAQKLNQLLGIIGENTFTFQLSSITGEAVDTKLSVMMNSTSQEQIEIAYETSYVDTDLKSAGYEKTVNTGANGVGLADYNLVYIDGELVQTNYVSTEVITEPVDQIIERGVLSVDKKVSSLGILKYPYQGKISSYFGWRSLGYHQGLDIVAYSGGCYGDDVYAAADGIVTFAQTKSGYGLIVYIDHGDGLVTAYAHLSGASVKVGDVVKTGDVVGQIGTSGKVTGPHLHFEVMLDGTKVDPLLFLKSN